MRRRNAVAGPLLSWKQSALVSKRVLEMRKAAGLLQYDIAFAAGVSDTMASRLEQGLNRWRELDAAKACALLGTTLPDVLAGGRS